MGKFAEQVMKQTGNRGVDVVFDVVGGEQMREALRCTRAPTTTGARVLVLGFAGEYEQDGEAGNRLSTRLILAKELHIIGVGTGLRSDRMEKILDMARVGRLPKPCVSHVVP